VGKANGGFFGETHHGALLPLERACVAGEPINPADPAKKMNDYQSEDVDSDRIADDPRSPAGVIANHMRRAACASRSGRGPHTTTATENSNEKSNERTEAVKLHWEN
jgi:hypothetical protein